MSFEDVSQALNKIVKLVSEVYRGYHQYAMIETIFSGLLMGEPVLLIGSHGSFKTSLASFVGRLFDKPVVALKEVFQSRGGVERFFEDLGRRLSVDPERLMRNLVDGANVDYQQSGRSLLVKVEFNAVKHPEAVKLGEARRKPIEVFSMQVNDQMDPEDILGYGVDHPAVLGLKPPHAIKRNRFAGADFICLDEIFGCPRLISKFHHALNEKVIDTTVGPIEVRPLGIVLCTNPFTKYYATQISLANFATLDRYALSARSLPPSSQEILMMVARRQTEVRKFAPIELIYEGRRLMEEVAVPEEFTIFCMSLVSHLSRCYFSPSQGRRAEESKDPFETEKDCSLCIYGREYPCGIANVGKVRTTIRLQQAMKAHALLNMRREADESDLVFALEHVLPHRLSWNDPEFLSEHGSMFTAAKALVERYAEIFEGQYERLREVEGLIKKPDAEKALELKSKYMDAPIVRSMLDEITDMMKESAKKRGDSATLEVLEPQLPNLRAAIKTLRGDSAPPA
jgi:MoxR-like ATPase